MSWLSSSISQLWALPLTGVLAVRGIGLDFFTVYKYSSFVVLFSVPLPRQQFFCHCSSSSRDLNSSFHLNYFIIINFFSHFTCSEISLFRLYHFLCSYLAHLSFFFTFITYYQSFFYPFLRSFFSDTTSLNRISTQRCHSQSAPNLISS